MPNADDYRAAAGGVVLEMKEALGVELKYDPKSIEWLDGYINRIRTQLNTDSYAGLAAVLGAYVGETIIVTYGGRWTYFEEQDQWGILLDDGNAAFPISKVYKQLNEPDGFHSI